MSLDHIYLLTKYILSLRLLTSQVCESSRSITCGQPWMHKDNTVSKGSTLSKCTWAHDPCMSVSSSPSTTHKAELGLILCYSLRANLIGRDGGTADSNWGFNSMGLNGRQELVSGTRKDSAQARIRKRWSGQDGSQHELGVLQWLALSYVSSQNIPEYVGQVRCKTDLAI